MFKKVQKKSLSLLNFSRTVSEKKAVFGSGIFRKIISRFLSSVVGEKPEICFY